MKRMTAQELDDAADRLEEIQAEEEKLRCKLQQQVEEFGFTPTLYQFTLSRGLTTEVKDAEVERIRENCPPNLFDSLFRTVTKYKLADGATTVLAGRLPPDAPHNLRLLFSRAVATKETAPRLRIEKAVAESAGACAT